LAEYRQALELLQNPITRAKDILNKIEKSYNRGGTSRGLLKEVSGAYLLKRFGIDPLLKDIQSVLNTLQRASGLQRKTTRASNSMNLKLREGGLSSFDTNNITYTHDVVDAVTVRGMSLDEVDLSFGATVGFSTKGLITLPWELIGYSFVADYFANIGDYLGALAPAPGYKLLGSSLTVSRVTSNSYSWTSTGMTSPAWELASPFNGSTAIVRELKTRRPLNQPSIVMRSDLKLDSFTRSATLMALLAQRFARLSKLIGPQPNLSAFKQKSSYRKWLDTPGVR